MLPRFVVTSLCALVICCTAPALVINVPIDQPTIQAGIVAATTGDTVLVADGTYYENIDFLGKAITVTSANGPLSTTIDGSTVDWVATFENFEGLDSLLEGFTITNGTGGIYSYGVDAANKTSPTLRGNTITGNSAIYSGGGISCYYSDALIEQNIITGNTAADGSGGGISIQHSESLITQNEISGNSATSTGGGIYGTSSDLTITRNTISGNGALSGGGISFMGSTQNLVMTDNVISGNIATYDGGGIRLRDTQTTVYIHNNVITDNEAGDNGGGIYHDSYGPLSLSGNRVSGNSANRGGGVSCFNIITANISNNLITDNTAQQRGGGLNFAATTADLLNNTIIGNQVTNGEGGGIRAQTSQLTLVNNILFFNSALDAASKEYWGEHQYEGYVDFSYCDVEGGQSSVNVEPIEHLTWGAGMIDSDPLLVNGPLGQAYLSQIAAGQASDSPCLDAGSDAATAVGFDTPSGWVDMGQMTTRTDKVADSGQVDLGWHYPGWQSDTISAGLTCQPPFGALPMTVQFSASLDNLYLDQSRRVSAAVDVSLAGGGQFPNWRSGWTNVDPGETFVQSWMQYFPALGSLVGWNTFTLTAADITPAPYNQPPYPPSGDTDTVECVVVTLAP